MKYGTTVKGNNIMAMTIPSSTGSWFRTYPAIPEIIQSQKNPPMTQQTRSNARFIPTHNT